MRLVRTDPDTVAPPIGTYSHAIRVEADGITWIYVSGQIANDQTGALVGIGDLRAQTERVFENLARILEANGATFADVVKLQAFVTTLDDLAGMREIRSRYLPSDALPASTAVKVAALVVPDALIEVDVVAAVRS